MTDPKPCPGCLNCTPASLLAGSIADETPRCGGTKQAPAGGDVQAALDKLTVIANRIADERNELLAAAKAALVELDPLMSSAKHKLRRAINRAEGRDPRPPRRRSLRRRAASA